MQSSPLSTIRTMGSTTLSAGFNSGIPEEAKGQHLIYWQQIEQTLAIFDPYVIPETYLAALEQADETTPFCYA